MTRWACTECKRIYASETRAGKCHWGVGGVIDVRPGETFEQAEDRAVDDLRARINRP